MANWKDYVPGTFTNLSQNSFFFPKTNNSNYVYKEDISDLANQYAKDTEYYTGKGYRLASREDGSKYWYKPGLFGRQKNITDYQTYAPQKVMDMQATHDNMVKNIFGFNTIDEYLKDFNKRWETDSQYQPTQNTISQTSITTSPNQQSLISDQRKSEINRDLFNRRTQLNSQTQFTLPENTQNINLSNSNQSSKSNVNQNNKSSDNIINKAVKWLVTPNSNLQLLVNPDPNIQKFYKWVTTPLFEQGGIMRKQYFIKKGAAGISFDDKLVSEKTKIDEAKILNNTYKQQYLDKKAAAKQQEENWVRIANRKFGKNVFKTMEDVANYQRQIGVYADGKWGNNTQAAHENAIRQNENLIRPINPMIDRQVKASLIASQGIQDAPVIQEVIDLPEYDNGLPAGITPGYGYGYGRFYKDLLQNQTPFFKVNGNKVFVHQSGGTIGGEIDSNTKAALVQAYMKATNTQDQNKANYAVDSIIERSKQGDGEAKKALNTLIEIIKKSQTRKDEQGAKLEYVKKLKGICPEGTEKVYLKNGGCMCQKKGGQVSKSKQFFDAKKEKCGGKMKKK